MGVLPCYRKDCNNIMCNTYVDGVGYICDDCKEEFESRYPTFTNEQEFKLALVSFLEIRPERKHDGIPTYEFFRPYTISWTY
jgi:hypothetical protein